MGRVRNQGRSFFLEWKGAGAAASSRCERDWKIILEGIALLSQE